MALSLFLISRRNKVEKELLRGLLLQNYKSKIVHAQLIVDHLLKQLCHKMPYSFLIRASLLVETRNDLGKGYISGITRSELVSKHLL